MHKMGSLDFDNMNCEKGMNILTVYVNSKLYNIIGSNEFARRLEGTGKKIGFYVYSKLKSTSKYYSRIKTFNFFKFFFITQK